MWDSVSPADIPVGVPMVAGYVDGTYAWPGWGWARFPGSVKVGIAVSPQSDAGQVLDVETGDATPAQAVGWVQRRRSAGVDPSVYCGASVWAQVRQAFQSAGVAEPHYWIAQWDGVQQLPAGAVAKQYANPTLSGGHFDLSVVADYWPGVDPVPPSPGGGQMSFTPGPVGFSLYSWPPGGTGWSRPSDAAAGMVVAAGAGGRVVVINRKGEIWQSRDHGANWEQLPGSAVSAAVDPGDGTVYVIGTDPR